MFAFLKRRAFPVVIGFLLLAAFIWFGGPYFAFADYRPLETANARLVAIALMAALGFVSALLKKLRAYRASDKLVAAVVKQSQAEERPSADALQLRERFEEAVATLKQKRRGGQSLYDLPWYVIIGAPGSGKTTALVNSGLHFPLEQRSGRGALRGVGGTRNCDWWFTDEAVFLDTAGRFTTQDSDAGADSAGWLEFLTLLRKYRTRRPVNGVILTISAQDLLTQHADAREAYVAAARRRLNELNRELRIQLPVYLMVTKCDLVAGFTEYFDDLTQEGRAQVWGITFPYEQTARGEAVPAYPAEFEALIGRLNARLFARLEEDRDSGRCTKMFGFPQQMAALRDLLGQFVTDVFASTRFDQQVLLRGIYFTSGTQEGTPIDRLLGAIGRRFAVAPEAVALPGGRGKAYFIERLLKDVMFGESGLAGLNRRLEVQKAAAQVGAYAAMAAVAILGVVLLSISYVRNRDYVAQVEQDLASLNKVPPAGAAASLESVLPRLDAVRAVSDSANRHADDTPWAMRWGLFQGTSLGNGARDAYMRELRGALLPQVAARIKERLVDYAPEPEKLYEYLKAYLMLAEPEHLDRAQLGFIADLEWKSLDTADTEAGAALSKHFASLLEYEDGLGQVELDQSLVAQARSTIRQASIGGLVYRQMRLSYASDTSRALRLDVAAGAGADRVLRRKSGLPLSQPVASLYTAPVFKEITDRGADDIVKQFAADQWVWGEGGAPRVGSGTIASEFTALYEKDYIAFWDGIVKDIEPVPMPTLESTKDALEILSGPTSPLRGLLKTVDEHTFLVKPPDPAQAKAGIAGTLGNVFNRGKQAIGLNTVPAGTQVTTHFAPIHRLVAGDQGAAPIDAVIAKLKEVQQRLQPVGPGIGGTAVNDPAAIRDVGEMVNSLKREATALPPSVATIVTQVADRTATTIRRGVSGTLESRYREQVLEPCNQVIRGRYPFVATSAIDVPLADFGRLFGYGGVFDTYFKDVLAPLVDTSLTPWTWRADASGTSVGPSLAMLRQFEAAQQIREMFFRPGGQEAEVRFRLTPTELDAGATRFVLEIDGQSVENRHGPERSSQATWPGQSPGPAAVTFETRSGVRPNTVFQGPWAWFRLMDVARTERETDVRYTLTFAQDGHEARVRLDAATIRNPFGKDDLQQFRCGA
ncbi:MAG TPA: type VI secretion system membrane subunit TssM [Vicinamibacterales bacterium]